VLTELLQYQQHDNIVLEVRSVAKIIMPKKTRYSALDFGLAKLIRKVEAGTSRSGEEQGFENQGAAKNKDLRTVGRKLNSPISLQRYANTVHLANCSQHAVTINLWGVGER